MLATDPFDVIVVGAGGSGLAAACRAAACGGRVLVLEQLEAPGGTTGLAVGSFTAAGTSPQQMAGIQDDPLAHGEDAARFAAPEIEARNQAEALVHSSEKSLKEYGDKVSEADRTAISEAIAALKTAAEGEDADAIEARSQTLAEVSMKLGQAMYEASQKEAAEADAKADAAGDKDVVDADFEEIDDDDKKKSA